MNDTQKLEEILTRLKSIEQTINPPLWKKIVSWVLSHFLFLLVLGIVAYFTWKTWIVIDHLQTSFENFKTTVGDNTNMVQSTIQAGFDSIKNFKLWK